MIILISGPTGVGKTKLSIKLAKKYNAEIINSDKMAMYKETNIGTAKIKNEEMDGIKHHFISNISLDDNYSIYNFQVEGRKIINDLLCQNKNIIIVGGSGLYVKALLYDYDLKEEEKNNIDFTTYTNEELKKIANEIYENNIHVNNRKRLERFISSNQKDIKREKNKKLYDFISIGLKMDRNKLYERLNSRVDKMFEEGLLEETKRLYKKYASLKYIIGYKELIPYLNEERSLEKQIEEIKKDTRHYAKRQYTWYKNQMVDIKWFDAESDNLLEKVIEFINLLQ